MKDFTIEEPHHIGPVFSVEIPLVVESSESISTWETGRPWFSEEILLSTVSSEEE